MRPLTRLEPTELDEEQKRLYDQLTAGPRAQGPQHFELVDAKGGLAGPFNAFLLQPALGFALQELGAAVRYQTKLSDRLREIAILVVATVLDSDFERYAHEPIARAAGVTDAELRAIRELDESEVSWPDESERTMVAVARCLTEFGDLDDTLYDQSVDSFGLSGIFEVMTLVGYYSTLAMQLRVLRVATPQN